MPILLRRMSQRQLPYWTGTEVFHKYKSILYSMSLMLTSIFILRHYVRVGSDGIAGLACRGGKDDITIRKKNE